MKNVRKRAGLAAGATLVGIGLVFPAVALAEDSGKTDAPSTEQQDSGKPGPRHGRTAEQRDQRQKELAEALAKDLGVPVEKVTGSLEKFHSAQREERTKKIEERKQQRSEGKRLNSAERQEKLAERLDGAVKDGKLTQDQADAILAAVKAGVFPGKAAGPRHDMAG
ncbi:hypothetical protein [Streptomyces sp. NPDC006879]|uniref:hypothetical protein n=1 Tax=Streptomyces sp. NPDC006879 TaxID=3364767 RepID=UPI0036B1DCAD